MSIHTCSHEESVLEMLRDDEAFATEYLAVALEEIEGVGGEDALLIAVGRLAKALGMKPRILVRDLVSRGNAGEHLEEDE